MRSGFRESRKQVAELNSQIEDSLLGIRVVKSFAGEDLEAEKFQKGNVGYLGIKSKVYHYMAAFHCTTSVLDGVLYILAVVAGAIFIIYDGLNPADLIVFLMYITTLLSSIRKIVQFAEQFQRGMTGIERFGEIMETEPDITDKPDAVELKNIKGDIEFKNVTFKYTEETEDVLSHLDLKIPAGMTCGDLLFLFWLSCRDKVSVYRAFNNSAVVDEPLKLHKLIEAAIHGETGKLPLDHPRKPHKSADVIKADGSE
jgi:ATP-binding cassette subfamily B protein